MHVTCEASPHHLCLTEQAVRGLDTRMKMNPPLRTEADRQALIEGLRSGVVDCIATDHAPHARDEKEVPFEQAPMGTTGLETAFAAVHSELVVPGVLDLATVVERMTAGGEPFGIPAPRVRVGEEANLVLVDLDAEWEVGEDGYESRSEHCCFAGRAAARARPAHARRRRRGLPRAGLRGDRRMSRPPAPTSCSRTAPASTATRAARTPTRRWSPARSSSPPG